MAAVLASGPAAVLSHRSAGRLWGLVPPSSRAIEVTRPATCRARVGIVTHLSVIPTDEHTVVTGIPVTTVPRTLLDLAAVLDQRGIERAVNEAEVRGLTDALSIPDLLERYPRRRGTAALRRLLVDEGAAREVTRSELEERFVAFLRDASLPLPRLNADIAVCGRFFKVDCLWAERCVIAELDGRRVHGTKRAFEDDRRRDRLLLVEGWQVMRITWSQLRDEAPTLAADLRRLLC